MTKIMTNYIMTKEVYECHILLYNLTSSTWRLLALFKESTTWGKRKYSLSFDLSFDFQKESSKGTSTAQESGYCPMVKRVSSEVQQIWI